MDTIIEPATLEANLPENIKAAIASVVVQWEDVSGTGSDTVTYSATLMWREKRFQIEVISNQVRSLVKQKTAANIKMWTNGGWSKMASVPVEDVPVAIYDRQATTEKFWAVRDKLVARAMLILN